MNEEDFDMEDEEEVQSSEDVEMKRVDIVAFVPGARDDAGVNAPMCVAEGDGVPLPEFGGSKIEVDGEEFEMFRDTDIVSDTVVPDKVKAAIKEESTLCLHCGKNFSNHVKLLEHINRYHEVTVFKCDICFKECKGKKGLQNHMRCHKQQVKCTGCHEHFSERCIKSHQLKCLSIPPLDVMQTKECPMEKCDFQAQTTFDLRKHLKKHKRKQENHLCLFCDLRFLYKKDLKAHMKIHAKHQCDKCKKSFKRQETLGRHREKCHASVSVTNSCGWFMAVNQEPEIIPMAKFHYCEKDNCNYKSKLKKNVRRHMATHRNIKVVKETTCNVCKHQFTKHSNLKRHKELDQCKKDVTGKVTVEDNIRMINANQTTSQVKLNNRLVRKAVGKKKVQSNIDKLLVKAKEAERKQWKCLKVKLWEKDGSGKLVQVETNVSLVRNATKYMLRGAKGRGYLDPRYCCVADGGQNKFLLSCTLTDKSDPEDINDKVHKSTGTMKNLLLLNCDVNCEIYENMVILSKLLKLDRFPHPLTFSGDLKLVMAWLGLSGPSGKFGCPYCTAQREQLGERKKGKWFGGQPRTFQRLLEQNQKLREKKTNKAKDFESCKHPPIRLSHGHDHLPLIHEFAPGPLHCMLLGRYILLLVYYIFSREFN